MGAFLTSAICLVSVFGLTDKAAAWSWYGFSELTLEDSVRGKEGSTIQIKINAAVSAQCFNVNSGQYDQPGVGNTGDLHFEVIPIADPDKEKGIVDISALFDIGRFDQHCVEYVCEDANGDVGPCEFVDGAIRPMSQGVNILGCQDDVVAENHIVDADLDDDHVCSPHSNVNKIEIPGTALINEFTAEWVWYNDKGKVINSGIDHCIWPGTLDEDGVPYHGVKFICVEESDKKINYVN